MKLVSWVGIILGLILSVGLIILGTSFSKGAKGQDKTRVITEKELEELVQQRVAKLLVKDDATIDQKILQPGCWHIAIFNDIEYVIYTGPGQIAAAKWLPPTSKSPPLKKDLK